jgi:hypothetical protein
MVGIGESFTEPLAPNRWHRTAGTEPLAPNRWHRTAGTMCAALKRASAFAYPRRSDDAADP